MSASTVVVTGGAGFVGSHVTDAFVARDARVEIIDDLSTGTRANVNGRAKLHELDIRSRESVELLQSLRPEVIVHLAAQLDVRKSVADPLIDASVNILGTPNLLEAVRNDPGRWRPRFILASTGGAVYVDFVTPPNAETTPKDPQSPYAIAKLSVEYYLTYYARVHGLDTVSLRLANVFGSRQDPHGEAGVVAIFCGRLLSGKALTIFGDSTQTRDYVYVGDVADAIIRAVDASLPAPERVDSRALNIGTGVATTVNRLAEALFSVAGRAVPVGFAPPRKGEQQQSFLDASKVAHVLGWRPRVTLEAGLETTYAWAGCAHRPIVISRIGAS
jgi:UDP-glucose 4-epimerase